MQIRKFLIADGNETALVYDIPKKERKKKAIKLLKEVEQVGFVSTKATLPKLEMMGGELCLNATLAFASTLKKSGKLATSGLKNPIPYSNNKTTSIKIPFKSKQENNVVLLEGIGFILYSKKDKANITKNELAKLCEKYNFPAFGGIIYEKNKIVPYVYVAGVNSFVKETACGSGSVAFSIFSGNEKVIQPTGKTISIKNNRLVEISAIVKEV
jgi:histidine racemase